MIVADLKNQHSEIRNIIENSSFKSVERFIKRYKDKFVFSEMQLRDLLEIYLKINKIKASNIEEKRRLYYKNGDKLFHVVESLQFYAEDIEYYSNLTLSLKNLFEAALDTDRETIKKRTKISSLLKNKIILNFFVQPSSRTHRSFEAAAKMLGVDVINEKDTSFSSLLSRKETLADTIRTFYYYVDAFIIRTPWNYSTEESIIAQEVCGQCKPVINAGSGRNDHPTQGFLDVTTVKEVLKLQSFKEFKKRKIVIIGTKYLRALKSFISIMSIVAPDADYVFINPSNYIISDNLTDILREKGINCIESSDLKKSIKDASVIYLACIEKEAMEDKENDYFLSLDLTRLLNDSAVILHPLPRVDELDYRMDRLPISGIWKQVQNGKFLRAVLLSACFDKADKLERIIGSSNSSK